MLLSIIIPTKNRYATLFNVVNTILDFDKNDELEIVIQDNSDNNTEALFFMEERKKFKNLKYFHESKNLSVIENSDKAVQNSIGDYVCFIGDDDGVMPYIIDVVKWMKKNTVKAVKSYKPNYYWPDQQSNYLSRDKSGVLNFKKFDYSVKKVDTKKALEYTLKKGGTSIKMLPSLYHSIVEKKVLETIYQITNSYFPGPSPDMANAVALTQVIDDYVLLGFPVALSGKSSKSTGGQGVLHQHLSRIEEVSHLPNNTLRKWTKEIPAYCTSPTIWAESVLKALENMVDKQKSKKMNFSYLYASLFVFNYSKKDQIFADFPIDFKSFKFYRAFFSISILRLRMFTTNRISFNSNNSFSNLSSIGMAINTLQNHVDRDKNAILMYKFISRTAICVTSAVVDIKKTLLKFDDGA
jgi:glycosyltransferase involved in cell wall biosynthesis